MTWPACSVCGAEVGEHIGQCPEGAQALFESVDHGQRAALAPGWRDNLRLTLEDATPAPVQPSLFEVS